MARLRFDNISSRGTSNPITFADGTTTTGTFSSAPGFPTIASPDYAVITVDPDTSAEEIVYLTAFTAGATTGTFTRAQEGTSGAAHSSKPWVHAPTAQDFGLEEYESWLTGSDISVSANTATEIVSLDLPAGVYRVRAQTAFANPAPNGNPCNSCVYVTSGSVQSYTAALMAAEVQSLAAGQGGTRTCEKKLVLSSATTLYLCHYSSPYSNNVWHFGNFVGDVITGLTALRLAAQ